MAKWRVSLIGGLLWVFLALPSKAQVSFGIYAGFGNSMDKGDQYALNTAWSVIPPPSSNNGSSSQQIKFYDGASSSAFSANVNWEATPIFSAGLVYNNTHFTGSASHRTGSSSSLGIQLKLNFVANTRKVIPFIQAGYMFTNSNTMHQAKATSTKIATQTQPAFELKSSTSLGIAADLGVEIKLSTPLSLVLLAGFRGVELTDSSSDAFIKALNYGAGFQSPSNIDGVFWIQGSIGLKYYVGVGKKKRDF